MLGTAALYDALEPARDESIEHPLTDPSGEPVARLRPEGARAVAAFWKRVPALDPTREYLWGDLARMTFRSGDPTGALEFCRTSADLESPRCRNGPGRAPSLRSEFGLGESGSGSGKNP